MDAIEAVSGTVGVSPAQDGVPPAGSNNNKTVPDGFGGTPKPGAGRSLPQTYGRGQREERTNSILSFCSRTMRAANPGVSSIKCRPRSGPSTLTAVA